MYLSYQDYIDYYPDDMDTATFNRLAWDASRYVDNVIRTANGVDKLRDAFPTDDIDKMAVIRCLARVVSVLYSIEKIAAQSAKERAYIEDADGSFHSAKIASVSSGSESISYVSGAGVSSASAAGSPEEMAALDAVYRETYIRDIVRQMLGGFKDANGVNLLYQGVYPCTRMR